MGCVGFGGDLAQGMPQNPPNYPPMSYYFPPLMNYPKMTVLYPQLLVQGPPLEASPYAYYIEPPCPVLSPILEEDEDEAAAAVGETQEAAAAALEIQNPKASYGCGYECGHGGENQCVMMTPTPPYYPMMPTYFYQPMMMMSCANMPYFCYPQDGYMVYGPGQPEYAAEVEAPQAEPMGPPTMESTGHGYEDPRGPFCKYTTLKKRYRIPLKKKTKNIQPCGFCKSNRQQPNVCRSHSVTDKFGNTTCPLLQALVCEVCGATGKKSHTLRFCPVWEKKRQEEDTFRPVSNGQKRDTGATAEEWW